MEGIRHRGIDIFSKIFNRHSLTIELGIGQ